MSQLTWVREAGLGPVTMVSCMPNLVNLFVVGLDGCVHTLVYSASSLGKTVYANWVKVGTNLTCAPCTPVTAVGGSGRIDIFVVGKDGYVYTAAWDSSRDSYGVFRGWWRIGTLQTVLHAHIAAWYVPANGTLNLSVVGDDGKVYWTYYPNTAANWNTWAAFSNFLAPPGAPLGASFDGTTLDLFVVSNSGMIKWWNSARLTWSDIYGLVPPRTPITPFRRKSGGDLTIAFCLTGGGPTGYVTLFTHTSAGWQLFRLFLESATWPRTPVTAIAGNDAVFLFIIDEVGGVQWCVSPPGDSAFQSSFQLANTDVTSQTCTAVGAFVVDNTYLQLALPDFNSGMVAISAWYWVILPWVTMPSLQTGVPDPDYGYGHWTLVGDAWSSGSYGNAQGMVTDGISWFMIANGQSGFGYASPGGLFGFPTSATGAPSGDYNPPLWLIPPRPGDSVSAHGGALCYYKDKLYVPLQDSIGNRGFGVWIVDLKGGGATLTNLDELWTKAHWAWCAVNPLNGRLYSSTKVESSNALLLAFDRDALTRCPEDDIVIYGIPFGSPLPGIDGGTFTTGGRFIMVHGPEGDSASLFCFSAVTGAGFAAKPGVCGIDLGMYGHDPIWGLRPGSETEAVTVQKVIVGSRRTDVLITEVDNWNVVQDDTYLHAYSVPDPDHL